MACGRRGKVFARYHATEITNPRQARNTLAYVLNNWRHHREDTSRREVIDPYSTGYAFDGWREPPTWDSFRGSELLLAITPTTWLCCGSAGGTTRSSALTRCRRRHRFATAFSSHDGSRGSGVRSSPPAASRSARADHHDAAAECSRRHREPRPGSPGPAPIRRLSSEEPEASGSDCTIPIKRMDIRGTGARRHSGRISPGHAACRVHARRKGLHRAHEDRLDIVLGIREPTEQDSQCGFRAQRGQALDHAREAVPRSRVR